MNRRTLLTSAASVAAEAGESARHARAATADFIQASDGTSLAIRDWGQGRPFVFLSAWSCPSEMWSYQMTPLSQRGFRCIAYDRRGHGRSGAPGEGYDLDTLADDLGSVLAALDLRGVILVGHSSASGEMVRYLTRHGAARIDRLVFSAPGRPYPTKAADNPDGLAAEALEFFRQKVLLHDFPGWLEEGKQAFFLPETSLSMQDWFKAMMLTTSMQAAIGFNQAICAADLRTEMARIDLPTLVIHGDRDASNPVEGGRAVAELIPRARFSLYAGAPHGVFITHVDRYNSELIEFADA